MRANRNQAKAILGAWKLLESAGLRRPWPTEDDAEHAVSTWALVLGDVDPERLLTLTTAWLRSPDARFGRWPLPGALLHALGDEQAVDDADTAWSEVLALLRARGQAWCCGTVPTAGTLGELRVAMATNAERLEGKGDHLRAEQQRQRLAALPGGDEYRLRALYAGLAAVGGWRGLALADEEALTAHRASFRSAYRGLRARVAAIGQEAEVAALLAQGRPPLRALPGGRQDGGR